MRRLVHPGRRTEVNCHKYNIGAPAFSIIFQNEVFSYSHMHQKACLCGISELLIWNFYTLTKIWEFWWCMDLSLALFVFRENDITIVDDYQYPDSDHKFERPPFCVKVRSKHAGKENCVVKICFGTTQMVKCSTSFKYLHVSYIFHLINYTELFSVGKESC